MLAPWCQDLGRQHQRLAGTRLDGDNRLRAFRHGNNRLRALRHADSRLRAPSIQRQQVTSPSTTGYGPFDIEKKGYEPFDIETTGYEPFDLWTPTSREAGCNRVSGEGFGRVRETGCRWRQQVTSPPTRDYGPFNKRLRALRPSEARRRWVA